MIRWSGVLLPFLFARRILPYPRKKNAWSQIRINSEEKSTSITNRKCVSIFNIFNSSTSASNIQILAMASVHFSKSLICFVALLLFLHKQVRKNHALYKAFSCTLNFRLSGKIQWVWPSFSFADCKWIGIFSNLLKFAEKHQTWEIQRWMLWWESYDTSWTKRVPWRMRHILQSLSKQAEHATWFVDWSLFVRRVYNRCSKEKFDLFHEHFIVE